MGTETGSSTRPQRAPPPASTPQRPSLPNATSQRNAPPNATRPPPAVNGAVNGAASKSGVVGTKSGVKTKTAMDGASGDAGPDADSAKPGKALPNQTVQKQKPTTQAVPPKPLDSTQRNSQNFNSKNSPSVSSSSSSSEATSSSSTGLPKPAPDSNTHQLITGSHKSSHGHLPTRPLGKLMEEEEEEDEEEEEETRADGEESEEDSSDSESDDNDDCDIKPNGDKRQNENGAVKTLSLIDDDGPLVSLPEYEDEKDIDAEEDDDDDDDDEEEEDGEDDEDDEDDEVETSVEVSDSDEEEEDATTTTTTEEASPAKRATTTNANTTKEESSAEKKRQADLVASGLLSGSTTELSTGKKTVTQQYTPIKKRINGTQAGNVLERNNRMPTLKPENDKEGKVRRVSNRKDIGSAVSSKSAKKKRKKKKALYICTVNCKYDVVRRIARRFGFKELGEEDEWNLYWTDYSVALERVMEMKKYQGWKGKYFKINHFPGMSEICRKDLLARNMNRLQRLFPKEYNVFPKSWTLPADYGEFQAYGRSKKNKTYICKPETGCQGKGIFVTKNLKDIRPYEHIVCQQYISKPFLVDGFKFDLRIYTLVTNCDPLRIFRYNDGLARFATVAYDDPQNANVENVFMHLTNYAINKHSEDFSRDDEGGSKRKISTVNRWFKNHGYNVESIWNDIDDVIIKTLISAHPILKHNYRTCFPNHIKGSACFEILGFDILLDRKLKPWLIEVNHSPSFHTDARLDREIKEALIYDTLNILGIACTDKRKCMEEEKRRVKERLFQRQNKKEISRSHGSWCRCDLCQQFGKESEDSHSQYLEQMVQWEDEHAGNYTRIYPRDDSAKYDKFFQHSGSLFAETAASKARTECARQQREEIRLKQEKIEALMNKSKRGVVGANGEARPESPGAGKKKKVRRIPLAMRSRGKNMEPVDTLRPLDIVAEEELERVSGMLQRDNLVRGLGLVDAVYRLLHSTPGTTGLIKGVTSHPTNQSNGNQNQFNPISHHLSDALTAKNDSRDPHENPAKKDFLSFPSLTDKRVSKTDINNYGVFGGGLGGSYEGHLRSQGCGDFTTDIKFPERAYLKSRSRSLPRQLCQDRRLLKHTSAVQDKFPETSKLGVVSQTVQLSLPPVKVADVSRKFAPSFPKPESYFIISGLKLNIGERDHR